MWATQPNSILGSSSEEALEGLYRKLCAQTGMDYNHVRFTPNPINSTIHIESVETSPQGQSGKYLGEITLPYQKISLTALFPQPVFYQGQWDMAFRFIARDIEEKLGWVIEPEDFIWSAGGVNLEPTLDTIMNLAVTRDQEHQITLTARPESIRFVAGSTVRLVLDATNRKTKTSVVYPNNETQQGGWIQMLRDESRVVSTQVPSIYNATNSEIVWGMLQRLYGRTLPANHFDYTVAGRPSNTRLFIDVIPKTVLDDQSIGQYEETIRIDTQSVSLQNVVPATLYLMTMESMTFERLRNVLLLNHGFRINSGEFSIVFGTNEQVLNEGVMIELNDYEGAAQLVARAHVNNIRWGVGSYLQLHFLMV